MTQKKKEPFISKEVLTKYNTLIVRAVNLMNIKFLVILLALLFAVIGGILLITFNISQQQPSGVNQIENVPQNTISIRAGKVLTSETGEQMYVEDTSGISFLIPKGWIVDSAYFYETAAGSKATVPSVTLKHAGDGERFLAYNLRQGCGRDIDLGNKSDQELLAEIKTYYSESHAQFFCINGITLASESDEALWNAGIFMARSLKFNR